MIPSCAADAVYCFSCDCHVSFGLRSLQYLRKIPRQSVVYVYSNTQNISIGSRRNAHWYTLRPGLPDPLPAWAPSMHRFSVLTTIVLALPDPPVGAETCGGLQGWCGIYEQCQPAPRLRHVHIICPLHVIQLIFPPRIA